MSSPWLRGLAGVIAAVVCAVVLIVLKSQLFPNPPIQIAPDTEATLDAVVLHFDPPAAPLVHKAYTGMLAALPDARFRIVVAKQADFEAFMARFEPPNPERFSPVLMDRPISTWSRDRYTMTTKGDRKVLLVPPQRPKLTGRRANDWLVPWRLALSDDAAEVSELDFDFDGGDIIAGPSLVFADANLMRKNPTRFPNPPAVSLTLEAILGQPVFVLGNAPEDVPHHHIGMYLTPLPDGAIAVGDPTLAIELLGGEGGEAFKALAARLTSEGLPAIDLRPETLHRFSMPARQLEAAGHTVVRLPLVPLDDMVTFITFNNGVMRKTDTGTDFLMPNYRLPVLDEAAQKILSARGLRVRPIDVADVFRHHGSVRCLINRM